MISFFDAAEFERVAVKFVKRESSRELNVAVFDQNGIISNQLTTGCLASTLLVG